MKSLFACALSCLVSSTALGATFAVTVGPGLSFTPSSVTIAPGDTVQWTWAGATHTSTSNATSGPEVWNSGALASGSFSHTFSTAGNWPYYCSIHSSPSGTAMNAVVHVVAPAPAPTPSLSIPLLGLLVLVLAVAGVFALRR